MIRRSAIVLGLVRAAVLMPLAAAFLSQIALAQQPAPSREALEAAERMISSQTRAGYSEASLSPMIAGAIDVHADAKALAAPIKSELTAAVAKSILARLPKPNDELVRVFASAMSLEELQAAAAFFDGPVVRRMSAATSQMKIEAGKPPEVSADFDAAMKEMALFYESRAGKALLEAMMANASNLQRGNMQTLMALTSRINEEVGLEMGRRGLKK